MYTSAEKRNIKLKQKWEKPSKNRSEKILKTQHKYRIPLSSTLLAMMTSTTGRTNFLFLSIPSTRYSTHIDINLLLPSYNIEYLFYSSAEACQKADKMNETTKYSKLRVWREKVRENKLMKNHTRMRIDS